jgi:hypothetical protein
MTALVGLPVPFACVLCLVGRFDMAEETGGNGLCGEEGVVSER